MTDPTTTHHLPAEPPVADDWVALHVFYSSNCNPLLEEGVAPLVAQLRDEGLIDGWFFIRYWMEGPHLRLRLHPSAPRHREAVLARARDTVTRFLKTRPSLYRMNPDVVGTLYRDMFLMEYSEEEWDRRYGAGGGMPLQEGNTVAEYPYEPEYAKYGGPRGVRLAEWHFERSSDLVQRLIATTNLHVRNVMFGLAVQLMATTTMTFLPRPEDGVEFHEGYQTMWETTFLAQDSPTRDGFETNYVQMRAELAQRLSSIESALESGLPETLPGFLGEWALHCAELRERVVEATEAGLLVFPERVVEGDRVVVTDPARTLRTLLVPFLHMTNNRLGVSIVEEVYLSHLVARHLSTRAEDVAS